MELLHPWMLLGLVLIPLAAILHVARRPRRRHEVSFMSLWRDVLTSVRPESSERKRRFDPMLLVEIAAIVLIVTATARPLLRFERPHRHVALIVDTSASMRAHDPDGASRWSVARERVDRILDELSDDDAVSVYAAPSPRLSLDRVTPDEARRRLAHFEPDDVPIDPEALLADGLAFIGRDAQAVYVVTDQPPSAEAPRDERVRIVQVGASAANVGITAFSLSRGTDGMTDVFVRVVNSAGSPAEFKVIARADERTLATESITVPPRGQAEHVFHLKAPRRGAVEIELADSHDALASDDRVTATAKPLEVVAVAEVPNPAYRRLFGGTVFDDTLLLEGRGVDEGSLPRGCLLIAEGLIPPVLGAMSVIVDPPEGEIAGIRIGREMSLASATTPTVNPLASTVADISLERLRIAKYRPLSFEAGEALMRVGGDTIAARANTPEGPVIVLGFAPSAAGWPSDASYVVFWTNVYAEALAIAGAGLSSCRTGDTLRIAAGQPVAVSTPDGEVTLTPGADGWGSLNARRTGLYAWSHDRTRERVAANLLNAHESDTGISAPPSTASLTPPAPGNGGREADLTPWFCIAAACMAAAWWFLRH